MTKEREIELLKEFESKLGANSYCGKWLESLIPDIERDIASDIPLCATKRER